MFHCINILTHTDISAHPDYLLLTSVSTTKYICKCQLSIHSNLCCLLEIPEDTKCIYTIYACFLILLLSLPNEVVKHCFYSVFLLLLLFILLFLFLFLFALRQDLSGRVLSNRWTDFSEVWGYDIYGYEVLQKSLIIQNSGHQRYGLWEYDRYGYEISQEGFKGSLESMPTPLHFIKDLVSQKPVRSHPKPYILFFLVIRCIHWHRQAVPRGYASPCSEPHS